MRWLDPCLLITAVIMALGIAADARAGPAMFQASFIMHAFGNDITTGTIFPYSTDVFSALPIGRNCRTISSYTTNGMPAPYFCGAATLQEGAAATGSGAISLGNF